ncbi:MAG: hypothetical protein ABUL72_06845 [Armatimonadota bacterium]
MSGVVKVKRVAGVSGELRPPSDKSLTHRAYILALMARPGAGADITYRSGRHHSDGEVLIGHALKGEDCESTRRIVEQLGRASVHEDEVWTRVVQERARTANPVQPWIAGTAARPCG